MNSVFKWQTCLALSLVLSIGICAQDNAAPMLRRVDPLAARVDGRLLESLRAFEGGLSSGESLTAGLREALAKSLPAAPEGKLALSLDVTNIDDQKLSLIEAAGARVIHSQAQWNSVTAFAAVDEIDALLRVPGVRSVRLARKPRGRQAGSVNNQGDASLKANLVRQQFPYTGAGVKIGVLSDYVNQTAIGPGVTVMDPNSPGNFLLSGLSNQNSGDLPATIQVIDFGPPVGPNDVALDEGAAMMELIYDIAPGANFAFASVFTDQTVMAANITKLRQAGCVLTVDDYTYPDEPFFQDGPVAQAIKASADAGVTHISAAGNDGDRGVLAPHTPINGAAPADNPNTPSGNFFHNWSIGGATPGFLPITIPAFTDVQIIVQWNQPYSRFGLGAGSTVDLNAYLYDAANVNANTLAFSVDPQGFNPNTNTIEPFGDPLEIIEFSNTSPNTPVTAFLAIDRYFSSGVNLNMRVVILANGAVTFPSNGVNQMTTFGHAASPGAIAVGAINFADIDSNGTVGPDTTRINAEPSSSEGGIGAQGVPYYFDTTGVPFPGGIQLRDCPDVAAPDGVATTFFTDANFNLNFFGTSASAANVAGVAALILERASLTQPAQMKSLLKATARDIEASNPVSAAGPDDRTGAGLVDALAAVNAAPGILTHPADTSTTKGGSANFSVTAAGSPTLAYQWQKSTAGGAFIDIPGATSAKLTLTNVGSADAGSKYRCRVSNPFGIALSKSATLSVTLPPEIVTPPKDTLVNLNAAGTFTVEAVNGSLAYQWRRNNIDIPGATAKDYTTPPVTLSDDGALYSVLVSNVFGSTLSSPGKLTVNLPPPILSGPTATPSAAAVGQSITFSATAAGSKGQAVTYSWDFGDGTIGSRNSVAHVYASALNYMVTLTVTDTNGAVSVAKLTVFVFSDADGDSVPDLDAAMDNSAFVDAFKQVKGLPTLNLNVTKLALSFNFKKLASDSLTVNGTLPLPAGFTPEGKSVLMIVGGVGRTFKLDAKGKAVATPNGKLKLSFKKKSTAATFGKFTITIAKANLQSFYVDEGLINKTAKNEAHTVRASVFFNDGFYDKAQSQSYTARQGSSGKTK